ncbi:sulfatase [Luteolibacter sp. GHJ8]|uniref:Sulfatase n=1 Tax=Luteolibacter rhizosphaerae TaxID=2989719 RepID=A0ABT3GAU8_9BACT|nr:sulfatase [Luteolibacter rhizosphaerae]MCW1916957.1 sulfatase [Luteolibacter rhizosphaerae]
MKLPALLFFAATLVSLAEEKRPNFLFIITDDQRWDAIAAVQTEQGGKARFPWLHTPALDKLKSQSASFRNAFCTTSLCSPSRATFLTGQFTHTHGVTNNHTPFPSNSTTYATVLKEHGYRTGYVGKWHMGNQDERPGYDFSASFRGQGKFFQCPVVVRKDGERKEIIADKWIDEASTDFAIDFLRQNKERPFLLTVGFKSVHGPREPHPDHQSSYTGESAKPVPNLDALSPFRPAAEQGPRRFNAGNPKLLDYFRTLTSADRALGRLLDEVDTLGLEKNTVVIFTSDNGYYLGEHGLGDKRSAYEESLRLPLLVRSPFHDPKRSTTTPIVLNLDLAPTIVDLAGITPPAAFQGRSLKPLLEGNTPDNWRKDFLYEYFYERNFRNPPIVAVRTESEKLVTYPGRESWNQLFEVRDDPYELTNQIANPEKAELRQRLEKRLDELKRETAFKIPGSADPDRFGNEKPARKARR